MKRLNFDSKEKELPKGVYFYYLKTKEGKINKKKIVKMK